MPVQSSQLHIDSALSNVSVQYKNDDFIADKIFPVIQVPKRSDKFFVYTKADAFNKFDPTMGAKDRAPRLEWSVGTDNYSVEDYGFEDLVSNADIANADSPLDPLIDTTETITDRLLLFREQQVANIVFTSGNYASANKATPGTKWGNAASAGTSSSPVPMLLTAIDALFGQGDYYIAFGQRAWLSFRQHPDVVSAITFTAGGVAVGEAQTASFFGAKEVYVGKARINASNRGQTASYSRIWDDHVMVFRKSPRPSIRSVGGLSAGFIMESSPLQTYRWDEPAMGVNGSVGLRVSGSWDVKSVALDAAYLLYDVVD